MARISRTLKHAGAALASLLAISLAATVRAQDKYNDLHDFGGAVVNANGVSGPDGYRPNAGVTFDAAANMYGTTCFGGAYKYYGVVWEITAAGAYRDLHDFGGTVTNANGTSGPDGNTPYAGVTLDAAGNLYGAASDGGAYNLDVLAGMVWEITAAGAYEDLHDFGGTVTNANGTSGPDGYSPYAGVTLDAAGNMYGTAMGGGAYNSSNAEVGMVWEITAAGAYKDLHDFGGTVTNASGATGPDGYASTAGVTFDTAGNMYGTASIGGAYSPSLVSGIVWEITAAGAYKDLHDFGGTVTNTNGAVGPDGANPPAAVAFDAAGNMYGVAYSGGAYSPTGNSGIVWEITSSGAYKDLHDFGGTIINANGTSGPDGYGPNAAVTFDAAGDMYGTTTKGGPANAGMAWEITAAGAYSDLHDFGGTVTNANGTSRPDGTQPQAAITLDAAGNLYGTAFDGGPYGIYYGMVWDLVRPPVLSSLSPAYAVAGSGAVTLTVNGSGFESGALVRWNGSALTTSFVSSTELRVTVPSTDLSSVGIASVTAVNPHTGASNGLRFTVVAPIVLNVLSPWSVTAASRQMSLRVSGAGFTSDCKVYWNGSVLATTYVSATEVDALIPAGDLTSPGAFPVTVQDNLGVVSQNSLTFTVTPPFPIHLAAVEVNPSELAGGATATGTVFLSGIAPAGGATVRLTSSRPGVASVPRFVVVSQGTSTATFRINTLPPGAATVCRITGTFLSVSRTGLLTVDP